MVRGPSPRPTIVAGDLNAKSDAWGSPRQDWRGARVLYWVADHGLNIVNSGAQNTCVRMRRCSIVYLTWANLFTERLIKGWIVVAERDAHKPSAGGILRRHHP